MNAKSILIADDDVDLASLLARRCEAIGLASQTAHDAITAINMIDAARPEVVILDVNMPGGNGLAICELMSSGKRLKDTPVIVLTGESQPETVRRCHEMCAYYVPKCPDIWRRIEPLLRELLDLPERAAGGDANSSSKQATAAPSATATPATAAANNNVSSRISGVTPMSTPENDLIDAVFAALTPADFSAAAGTTPCEGGSRGAIDSAPVDDGTSEASPWILCIDDDPDMSRGIQLRLREHGIAVRRAFAGMEGYRRAFSDPAQAIILDFEMPNGNGDYVLRRLKENPVTRDVPVIVLTGRREKFIERTMYNLGAAAFLTKPYDWNQLWNELQRYVAVPTVSASH